MLPNPDCCLCQVSNASNSDDFPHPFGPTSTISCARSGTSIVRSVNRLKSFAVICFSFTFILPTINKPIWQKFLLGYLRWRLTQFIQGYNHNDFDKYCATNITQNVSPLLCRNPTARLSLPRVACSLSNETKTPQFKHHTKLLTLWS